LGTGMTPLVELELLLLVVIALHALVPIPALPVPVGKKAVPVPVGPAVELPLLNGYGGDNELVEVAFALAVAFCASAASEGSNQVTTVCWGTVPDHTSPLPVKDK